MADFAKFCGECGASASSDSLEIENTSGSGARIPTRIEMFHWHWGAFLLPWLWLFFHGMPGLGLFMFVLGLFGAAQKYLNPVLNVLFAFTQLGTGIYIAVNAHKWAWLNRRYPGGYNQYIDVETAWSNAGIGITVATIVITILVVAVLISSAPVKPNSLSSPSYPAGSYPGQ